MYLATLDIRNFRCFGDGSKRFHLDMRPGLTALVGENDAGKTAVVDALRFALGTSDHERLWLDDGDFFVNSQEIQIACKFQGLTEQDRRAFVEYFTYEGENSPIPVLYVNWVATKTGKTIRGYPYHRIAIHSGRDGHGPNIASETRDILRATYLRPLRDAEQALSAGRGSRLSQILKNTSAVTSIGQPYDAKAGGPELILNTLSVLGIADLANKLISEHTGIKSIRNNIDEHLKKMTLSSERVRSNIDISGANAGDDIRLKGLLEKLNLTLGGDSRLGLGSNNLLFMACELLLLAEEDCGAKLVLIEEPESHLDTQRQLRAMSFLQEQAKDRGVQVILTTHSPNLASAIDLENIVLIRRNRAFSLSDAETGLSTSDYRFLQRFLDVTKANLFFARGVVIVEGDAENILLPTLAKLIGKDFTEHGVSIVNVRGVGLRRYAKIFHRAKRTHPEMDGHIEIPVACLADMDVMPDCAPAILGKIKDKGERPPTSKRRWRSKSDFQGTGLSDHRAKILSKADGQNVKTFVADEWTFEYDLALGPKDEQGEFSGGLSKEVFVSASLALKDETLCHDTQKLSQTYLDSLAEFGTLEHSAAGSNGSKSAEVLASHVYAKFAKNGASKAVAAQYLADCLSRQAEKGRLTPEQLRAKLPKYVVKAIDYVTTPLAPSTANPRGDNHE